ncbi:Sucrose nonfermenting 4-like protein [Morella rubra]|uniref:Sucrose nonfermenting 4-like protein n=1 Tax=Morella rubra TaxID=262757 RepID=A0A6A1V5P7_9ROSI|nr:Sucrose nonfermenting 4-like protein [Morella rubra]
MYIFADIRYFQGISVAPLWDFCNDQYVGVLSALDFILILREEAFVRLLYKFRKKETRLDHNLQTTQV